MSHEHNSPSPVNFVLLRCHIEEETAKYNYCCAKSRKIEFYAFKNAFCKMVNIQVKL